MPTVVNGIGTWYYGKRRIHRRKDVCSFCNAVGDLQSYDTTLFFVVIFVPVLPLGRKRILEECPSCRKHHVTSLKKWEQAKADDVARILEQLQQDPDDRNTIRTALGLAIGYQDEVLFDKLASALAEPRGHDAALQTQLADGYTYFVRYDRAEAAYRAALAAEDDLAVRQRLAFVLLKQSRPEEAHPYLQHILDQRLREEAGQIYLLTEAYQAQGMHREALDLMDQRDAAFPDLADLKDYQKQRQTSERYLHSGKKIKSAFLTESSKAGYREGGWASRLPLLIGPLIALALLIWYLGAAVWIGQARKVHLVNGSDRPYVVAINGREQTLQPGAPTSVRVPEGEVVVEIRGAPEPFEPVRCRIETPFFSRPFKDWTFVINPDQLAVLWWQEATYAVVPPPAPPPQLHLGKPLYAFEGVDYEFVEFPGSLQVEGNQTIRKQRVSLNSGLTPEARLGFASSLPNEKERIEYARHWLQLDPDNAYALGLVASRLGDEEAIAFLRPRLTARPLRIETHRAYQNLMNRAHPEQDLRPEYEQLAAELKKSGDALYLLGRARSTEDADALFRQAAEATPPSAYGLHAVGYDALARGNFDEAVTWAEKAVQLAPDKPQFRQTYHSALLAARRHDRLLEELRSQQKGPEPNLKALLDEVRVLGIRGEQAQAREMMGQVALQSAFGGQKPVQELLQRAAEVILCCAAGDAAGYLKQVEQVPNAVHFEQLFLQGKLQDAADVVDKSTPMQAVADHSLLYLAARQAKDEKLADGQWQLLLDTLPKIDRHSRRLAEILAGRQPLNVSAVKNLPLAPEEKRVLLAVVAHLHPEHAKDLVPLARALDFQRDATSLCLRQVLGQE